MRVLDGRNSNKVPKIIESDFVIRDAWIDDDVTIFCLEKDGEYIPCVVKDNTLIPSHLKDYDGVLCASYKTIKGVENWVCRFYERAKKIENFREYGEEFFGEIAMESITDEQSQRARQFALDVFWQMVNEFGKQDDKASKELYCNYLFANFI